MQQLYRDMNDLFATTAQKVNAYICYGTVGWEENLLQQQDLANKQTPNYQLDSAPFEFVYTSNGGESVWGTHCIVR